MRRLRWGGPTPSLLAVAALTAALVGAAGCRPDFPPYNRVTGLRVLAIQSEPAAPITGETATFSALVVTPSSMPPPATIAYHWSWCPFAGIANDGYQCVVDEAQIDGFLMAAGMPALPAFDLGTAPTATFPNQIPPAVFAAVCQGGLPGQPEEFKLDCTAGFPIQITLTVATDTDTLTAVQNVKLRFDPVQPANLNPVVDGLQVLLDVDAGAGGVLTVIPPLMPDPNAPSTLPVTLARDVDTPLRVTMDPAAAESYPGLDDNKNPATLTERLFLTWFVESGDTRDPRTSFFSGTTVFTDMLKNSWTPAKVKDYPADSARIYVVAHDNRGGASWRAGIVNLEPSP